MWRRIHSMLPIIREQRDEGERLRRLPDAVARAFVEANVPRLMLPHDLGGDAIDPISYFDMTEVLARADASAAWNFSISAMQPTALGGLSTARLRELFSDADSGLAGTLIASGTASPVPGGHRVTGRWGFGSGVHHARWILVGAAVDTDGGESREHAKLVHFVIPAREITVLDTWHTGGLRATGSSDFTAQDVFVPTASQLVPFPGCSEHPSPIFRMPFTFFGLSFAAVALGVAHAAVDGLIELAAHKTSLATGALRCSHEGQYAVAKSQALLDAHRESVRASFAQIWEQMQRGEAIGASARARARRAYVAAVEAAQEAVVLCYRAAGGSALFVASPFERALRDVFAVSGHAMVRRARMEMAGEVAFGMTPTHPAF